MLTVSRLASSTSVGVIAANAAAARSRLSPLRSTPASRVMSRCSSSRISEVAAELQLERRVRRVVDCAVAQNTGRVGAVLPGIDRLDRAGREHEPFEQRVRREPVGAVHAGAGGLAAGPEAGQRGGAVEVGADATREVVRGGGDGQPVVRGIEADARHASPDRREAGREVVDPGGVEPEVVEVALDEPAADRLGDDVAWREVGERVLVAP